LFKLVSATEYTPDELEISNYLSILSEEREREREQNRIHYDTDYDFQQKI